jgi:hypothetical protein
MPIGLKGNTDGSGAVQIGGSDAITISTGLNTTFAGTVTASGGVLYPLTSGTAVASTSGTALDFTGIPSWVKRITVMFDGVSTSGSSNLLLQLGTSGGFQTTGYNATGSGMDSTVVTSAFTTGFGIRQGAASNNISGAVTISLLNATTGVWCSSGVVGSSANAVSFLVSGDKTLSGTLDRVRITTVNGTDTFDAGSINILYE